MANLIGPMRVAVTALVRQSHCCSLISAHCGSSLTGGALLPGRIVFIIIARVVPLMACHACGVLTRCSQAVRQQLQAKASQKWSATARQVSSEKCTISRHSELCKNLRKTSFSIRSVMTAKASSNSLGEKSLDTVMP